MLLSFLLLYRCQHIPVPRIELAPLQGQQHIRAERVHEPRAIVVIERCLRALEKASQGERAGLVLRW